MSKLPIFQHFLSVREFQAKSRVIFQAKTQANILLLNWAPDDWKTAAFYQQPRGYWVDSTHKYQGYTVVTEQYRYSEYVNLNNLATEEQTPNWGDPYDFGELYDLVNDPLENTNLIHDEAYDDIIKELKQLLHQGWHHHN